MVLLIPAEVINTVHKLAIACKKYKGIVFTDKHGNIINEDNDENDDTTHDDDADDPTEVHDDPTGVLDDATEEVHKDNGVIHKAVEIPENNGVKCEAVEADVETNTGDITGVTDDVMDGTKDYHEITGVTIATVDSTGVDGDDNISVKSEEHEGDNHVTIDDLYIIEQMNTAQMNTDPETGDDATDGVWCTVGNHGYNLRPRPTRVINLYAFAQDGQQSAEIKMAKPHAYLMMTQVSIKQGIKAFGECGSDAMLKELNQLHE